MKKFRLFAAMCVLVLALGAMAACGGNSTESTTAPVETTADTTVDESTADTTVSESTADTTVDESTADTTVETTAE